MSSVHNIQGHYIEFLYIVALHNTLDNINPPLYILQDMHVLAAIPWPFRNSLCFWR